MIEFLLVLQLCMGGVCYPPLTDDVIYPSYKTCIVAGYHESLGFIEKMDDADMQRRPIIRFWCQEMQKQNI